MTGREKTRRESAMKKILKMIGILPKTTTTHDFKIMI
jgi:hypothetical protein